jgi:hypothetical protein
MKYERLEKEIVRVCKHCNKEYIITNTISMNRFPIFCRDCSMAYGHLVYKCNLCGVIHFHTMGMRCSLCPGETIDTYVFPSDGRMDKRSRYRAWEEAGRNNPGKW